MNFKRPVSILVLMELGLEHDTEEWVKQEMEKSKFLSLF